jgi:hypothetical protein
MSERMCANCAFWHPPEKPQTNGQCRCEPPMVFLVQQPAQPVGRIELGGKSVMAQAQMGFMSSWPPTAPECWCGKHELVKTDFEATVPF